MYQGKHISRDSQRAPRKSRHFRWSRQLVLLASVLALLVGAAGSTLAYLNMKTTPVVNSFQSSRVTCQIRETFTTGAATKNNVYVTNTGDTDAYIRAAIVVTWTDENGNIVAQKPEADKDYKLVIEANTGWKKSGDYYYYTSSVAPNGQTGILVNSCKPIGENAQKYQLTVDIIADAIQSQGVATGGTKAVVEAWGVDPTSLG